MRMPKLILKALRCVGVQTQHKATKKVMEVIAL